VTTTTLVACVVSNNTVAPLAKPVPVIVTDVPPSHGPLPGVTFVTVTTGGAAVTVTSAESESEQPAAVVTVTLSVSVPVAPAVKPIEAVPLPLLIVQGGRDLQVSTADAQELLQARPKSKLVEPVAMNHVMKDVLGDDRATNLEAYLNLSLPVDRELVESVAAFVKAKN